MTSFCCVNYSVIDIKPSIAATASERSFYLILISDEYSTPNSCGVGTQRKNLCSIDTDQNIFNKFCANRITLIIRQLNVSYLDRVDIFSSVCDIDG